MNIKNEIADLEAQIEQLKFREKFASCLDVGHNFVYYGGKNAGCSDECYCSIPVYVCDKCGDYDYGENEESYEIIRSCGDMTP